jgi:hypothetical protein
MKIVKQTSKFIVIQSDSGACLKINISELLVVLKVLTKTYLVTLLNKLKTK